MIIPNILWKIKGMLETTNQLNTFYRNYGKMQGCSPR
jgi:hypothetical protein